MFPPHVQGSEELAPVFGTGKEQKIRDRTLLSPAVHLQVMHPHGVADLITIPSIRKAACVVLDWDRRVAGSCKSRRLIFCDWKTEVHGFVTDFSLVGHGSFHAWSYLIHRETTKHPPTVVIKQRIR